MIGKSTIRFGMAVRKDEWKRVINRFLHILVENFPRSSQCGQERASERETARDRKRQRESSSNTRVATRCFQAHHGDASNEHRTSTAAVVVTGTAYLWDFSHFSDGVVCCFDVVMFCGVWLFLANCRCFFFSVL